jgi:hypothetical protein
MLQAMSKLTTKADVLRLVISFAVCLGVWLIIEAFFQEGRARVIIPLIFAGIFLVIVYVTMHALVIRASKLLKGRCPNPMCHGTVHHSEHVRKGQLLCPTCKSKWPEVPGIRYLASGREH